MKCKGCSEDITQTLEMLEEALVTRVSQILGIIPDSENVEGELEIVVGKVDEEFEYDFEITGYQCGHCYVGYNLEEIKEIFK